MGHRLQGVPCGPDHEPPHPQPAHQEPFCWGREIHNEALIQPTEVYCPQSANRTTRSCTAPISIGGYDGGAWKVFRAFGLPEVCIPVCLEYGLCAHREQFERASRGQVVHVLQHDLATPGDARTLRTASRSEGLPPLLALEQMQQVGGGTKLEGSRCSCAYAVEGEARLPWARCSSSP